MMSLKDILLHNLKEAMRNKDTIRNKEVQMARDEVKNHFIKKVR